MSQTFYWCKDKTRLAIWNKPVFYIDELGDKNWLFNGIHHRENGPAAEWTDGTKCWYLNGELHRKNGPAVEYASGAKWWYLNGKYYNESGYWKELKK